MALNNLIREGIVTNSQGEQGKAVFIYPFLDLSDTKEWNATGPSYIARIHQTQDDRGFAILSAIVTEHYLDRLLSRLFPGYGILTENHDFTFSMKLDLLTALAIIPRHIIDCANVVRQVRNEFAHNLEITSFSELNQKYIDKISRTFKKLSDKQPNETTIKQHFFRVNFVALIGFAEYEPNIRLFRSVIESKDFLKMVEEKGLPMAKKHNMQHPLHTKSKK